VIEHQDEILSVTWSPDSAQLAWGSGNGSIEVWRLTGPEIDAAEVVTSPTRLYRLTGHRSEIHSVAWSPDGQQLASAGGVLDNRILLWDLEKPGTARIVDGHTGAVRSVAWSPDGSGLASASWDNTVRIWDRTGRPLQVLKGHTDWALSVAWAPEGKWLASGDKDGSVRIWGADGKPALTLPGHTDQVTSVAWSPDGYRLASAGWDAVLRIWRFSFENGIEARTELAFNTPGAMTSVAWSPDGERLAMASEFRDSLARILDINTGEELQVLAGHVDLVKAVAWSPDGKYLATAGADGTVRIWGIPSDTDD
jgi:WD40 repeat protein